MKYWVAILNVLLVLAYVISSAISGNWFAHWTPYLLIVAAVVNAIIHYIQTNIITKLKQQVFALHEKYQEQLTAMQHKCKK